MQFNLIKYTSISALSLSLIALFNTAQAHNHEDDEEVTLVEIVEKPGRSEAEYFFSPFVGINYSDVTGISSSAFTSDSKSIFNNNTANVNQTDPGVSVGFFVDGQYQITALDYWRAGFQTGLFYESPNQSKFNVMVCDGANNSNCDGNSNNAYSENGTLKFDSVNLPVLFTFSRYAEQDDYIVTLKLGPVVSFNWYDLDFDGFTATPDHETQVLFAAGIDGRYRMDEDNFLLVGFLATNLFGGSDNSFSGVNTFGEVNVYLGWSFS
ncbi:MAG: hypothetical protein ABSF18_06035 [Gammaproteobacteria bacterium]